MQLRMTVQKSPKVTDEFRHSGPVVKLGRNPDGDLVVDHDAVSWDHAKIDLTPYQATLTDLGSTNGTFKNSQRITDSAPLWPGDAIKLGQSGPTLTIVELDLTSQGAVPPPNAVSQTGQSRGSSDCGRAGGEVRQARRLRNSRDCHAGGAGVDGATNRSRRHSRKRTPGIAERSRSHGSLSPCCCPYSRAGCFTSATRSGLSPRKPRNMGSKLPRSAKRSRRQPTTSRSSGKTSIPWPTSSTRSMPISRSRKSNKPKPTRR